MQREKEIEMLISRYRTDIAALEEREEDLRRQSDVIENMIPNVLVSYMGKVVQTSRDKPFPQQEIETEVIGKVEHLKKVLKELQVVIGLVKEEKNVMGKRIEELETFLADQPEKNFDKIVDVDSPKPMTKNQEREDTMIGNPEANPSKNLPKRKEETECQRKKFEKGNKAKNSENLSRRTEEPFSTEENESQRMKFEEVNDENPSKNLPRRIEETESQRKKFEKGNKEKNSENLSRRTEEPFSTEENESQRKKFEEVNDANRSENLSKRTEETESQRKKFEKVNKVEGTDWEKVCKDLEKQVADLTANLNNSSRKLKESKEYIKNLEEKFSNLKKELETQMKSDMCNRKILSETVNKKRDFSMQELNKDTNSEKPDTLDTKHTSKKEIVKTLDDSTSESNTKSENPDPVLDEKYKTKIKSKTLGEQIVKAKSEKPDSILDAKSKTKNENKKFADQESQPKTKKTTSFAFDTKQDKGTRNLEDNDQLINLEELLQSEDTDWKKVYEDLQKQVLELTENLNDSLQKLSKSKSYVRKLEDKYSNLKKELQTQIQTLEKRADSFISDVTTDKGKEKNLPKDDQIGTANKESQSLIMSIGTWEAKLGKSPNDLPQDQFQVDKELDYVSASFGKSDAKSEGLSLSKNTDWKKVCEDLQKQVRELNKKLNQSTQKFTESEDYIKHLQGEYSKLEKELRVKIQTLEKRTDKLISAIGNKEQDKYTQEDLETKGTISAIRETLSEVRSMKEILTKPSKVYITEPIVEDTGINGSTSEPIESPDGKVDTVSEEGELQPQPLSSETAEIPDESVETPKIPVSLAKTIFSKGSESINAIALVSEEGPVPKKDIADVVVSSKGLQEDITEKSITSDIERLPKKDETKEKDVTPEATNLKENISHFGWKVVSPETTDLKEDISEPAESPIHKLPLGTDVEPVSGEKAVVADMTVPSEAEVSKEEITKPIEAPVPETEATAVPESEVLDKEETIVAEGVTVLPQTDTFSKEEISEPTEVPVPEKEKTAVTITEQVSGEEEAHAEDVVLPETTDFKEEISKPTEGSITESGTPVVPEIETTAGGPTEMPVPEKEITAVTEKEQVSGKEEVLAEDLVPSLKKEISEPTKEPILEKETSVVPETEQVPDTEVLAEDAVVLPETADLKEEVSEPTEAQIAVSETPVGPEIKQVSGEEAEDLTVPPEATVSKEEIPEPTESLALESETPAVPEIDHVPEDVVETTDLKEDISQPTNLPIPGPENPVVSESEQVPDKEVALAEDVIVPPETADIKEEISEPTEALITESGSPVGPEIEHVSGEEAVVTGDVTVLPEAIASKEEITEPTEALALESEPPAVPEIDHVPDKEVALAEDVIPPETTDLKENISQPTNLPIPGSEKLVVSESEQVPDKEVALAEDVIVPPETADIKEEISEPTEALITESGSPVGPEIEHVSGKEAVVTGDVTVLPEAIISKEEITEPTEALALESEPPAVPEIDHVPDKEVALAEDVIPPETTDLKENISQPTNLPIPGSEKPVVSESEQVPDKELALAEDVIVPPETADIKEEISKPTEALIAESGLPVGPEIEQVSGKEGVVAGDVTVLPEAIVSKEEIPKQTEEPESQHVPAVKEEAKAEDSIVANEIKVVSKEHITEPTEAAIPETLVVPKIDQGPDSAIDGAEITPPSDCTVLKEAITEPTKDPIPASETLEASITDQAFAQVVPDEGKKVTLPKATVSKEAIPKPIDDVIPISEVPFEHEIKPVSAKLLGDAEAPSDLIGAQPDLNFAEISPKKSGSTVELKQDPGMIIKRQSSVASLATQTLRNKMQLKDHLIKAMADQLRELVRNNMWTGRKALEADVNSSPAKTYDWDRYTLHLYLKGEEPPSSISTTVSNEASSKSNPLKAKILGKLDKDSLMIEWGPPPSEVVGVQIYLDGQFKYWIHSVKRNKALLHPLDLRSMLEITINPVDVRGAAVHKSTIFYKP